MFSIAIIIAGNRKISFNKKTATGNINLPVAALKIKQEITSVLLLEHPFPVNIYK